MPLSQKTIKRADSIIKKIRDYMDIRFAHACRVNQHIRHIYEDVRWQQLASLRHVISRSKAFGPDRYYVADILCEDNASRKKALFTPTDQNSILNEIINLQDISDKDKTAGQLPIHDMRTFYRSLDPSLEHVVELIQTWIWWDLADASDLVLFEHQVQVVKKVMEIKMEGPIIEHYQKVLHKAGEDLERKDIVSYEFKRLEDILKGVEERRAEDEGYMMIVKRNKTENNKLGTPYNYKEFQLKKLRAIVEQFRQKINPKPIEVETKES